VQEAYSRRDKLQREIKEIRGSLEVAVSARDRLRSDIEASNRVLEGARSKDARIAALANELRKWQDRIPPLIERFQQRNSEALQLKRDLASAQERIAKLEIAGNTDSLTNGSRDELQRIKGIGPAIQKTLNEIGIFSFQQIADMSEYDIDQVAKRLKGFHSRIYREDWIGQARDLHAQETGGQ
jgi:predicted flap endonuclease-1-like 5' DNA nuclease